MTQTVLPVGDHPISDPADDVLGRDSLARALANEVASIDASQGVVAAITGPWGCGKTSLLNLAATHLREHPGVRVMDFNPWLFSGADELASAFLGELARELSDRESSGQRWRKKSAGVADALANYSAALHAVRFIPGIGTTQQVLEGAGKQAASVLRGDTSIPGQRQRAIDALSRLDGRVVVLVDDIDRLNREELRHLFRMVRLTASFPNIVYLLSLDRQVVARALTDEGFPGSEYLEKILSLTCAVPLGQPEVFRSAWLASLNVVLERHPQLRVDEDAFGQVQLAVLDPLMQTLRDAKRVLTSLPLAIGAAGREVAFADLLALEALRVLAPDLHAALPHAFHGLTALTEGRHRDAELAQQVQAFITSAGSSREATARAVVETLFPAAQRHLGGQRWAAESATQWRHQGRVADARVLEFYLTGRLAPGVASRWRVAEIEQALAQVETGRTAFAAIRDEELENLLEQLIPFSEVAEPDVVGPAVEVLLEQFTRLRTEPKGMMDFGAEFAITRPVLRLLRRLPTADVYALSRRLVPSTPSLFGAYELVSLVGHQENAGHRLVTQAEAAALEQLLRQRIESASAEELAQDRQPLRFLFHAFRPAEAATEPVLALLSDSRVAAALLRDSIAVSRSQTVGSTRVNYGYTLHWDILTRLFGGEARLLAAADQVRSALAETRDEQLSRALDLVDRYRTGWRPPAFGEE